MHSHCFYQVASGHCTAITCDTRTNEFKSKLNIELMMYGKVNLGTKHQYETGVGKYGVRVQEESQLVKCRGNVG